MTSLICNSAYPVLRPSPKSAPRLSLSSSSITKSSSPRPCRRKTRGLSVVTRAGPGTSTYVLAFVLPLSLVAITVFASIRIADKLDKDFLEEIALNQAIMEADEDGDAVVSSEEKPALPRTRNRPKREAET